MTPSTWFLRSFLIGVLVLSLVGSLPQTGVAQFEPDDATLFLAHFDRSLDADVARGKKTAAGRGELTFGNNGRFGEAVRFSGGRGLSYSAKGNLNPSQGTVELWLCLEGGDLDEFHIFSFRSGDHSYLNVNQIRPGRLGAALCGGPGDDWVWRRVDYKDRGLESGVWHHLAATWGEGELAFYVDGQPVGPPATDAKMPVGVPDKFTLHAMPGYVDELRISSKRRSAAEIQAVAAAAGKLRGPVQQKFLTDLPAESSKQDRGQPGIDARLPESELGVPIVIDDRAFPRGLATVGNAEVTYALPGGYDRLVATTALSDLAGPKGSVVFQIVGDGRSLFKSRTHRQGDPPERITVGIKGVRQLRLVTTDAGDGPDDDWADWGELVLLRPGQPLPAPQSKPLPPYQRKLCALKLAAYRLGFQLPASPNGYRLVPWNVSDDLDPARPPETWPQPVRLETFATPGEREPLSLIIYADRPLTGVIVKTSDLRGPDGVIVEDRIDLRYVMRCPYRKLYTRPAEESELVSRFLLKRPSVDLRGQSFREVHALIHVPQDAPPGKYAGLWRITPTNAPPTDVSVVLTVLPFRLGRPGDRQFGMYYRFGPLPDALERTELELADMRAHGVTTLKPNLAIRYVRRDDEIQPSFDVVLNGLRLMQKHGFRGTVPIGTGLVQLARMCGVGPDKEPTPAKQARFEEAGVRGLKGLVKLGEQFPDLDLVATHMDEVLNRGRLPLYRYLTKVVRRVPELRMYITIHNRPTAEIAKATASVDPYVDIRCYNGHSMDDWLRAGHTFAELSAELRRSGDEAWMYYNIRGSCFTPEWTRLVNGVYLWMSPLRAHVPWMYHHVTGNPLDDTDGPRIRGHDFGYAVPSPLDGMTPVPTRHWEAYREGIDDLRYISLLEDLIRQVQPKSPQAAERAQAWLAELRGLMPKLPDDIQDIEGESPVLIWLSRKYGGDDYQRWRRRTADEIVRLLRHLGRL